MAEEEPADLVTVNREEPADLVSVNRPAPIAASWNNKAGDELSTTGQLGRALNAFGQGFKDNWGAPSFGAELEQEMQKAGMFYDPGKDVFNPPKAFNSAFVRPGVWALGNLLHGAASTYAGVHEAGKEVLGGAPAALMEAFPLFGAELGRLGWRPRSPGKPTITGGVGDVPDLRVAKDLGVIGPERPPLSEGTPAQAIENRMPPITAYHGSPYSFDAFSMEKIGTGEGAQSYGHGLYFAEHPEVAENYLPSRPPLDENGQPLQPGTQAYTDWAQTVGANKYQVRIHADPEKMLDLDKTYSEQTPTVRKILDKFGVSDESGTGFDILKGLQKSLGFQEASDALREAGIPGNKYLDQGSRPTAGDIAAWERGIRDMGSRINRIQADMEMEKDNPNILPGFFKNREQDIAQLKADIAAREQRLADLKEGKNLTSNFVIFNDKDVEITHRNGEPVQRAMPAEQPKPEVIKGNPQTEVMSEDQFNARVSKIGGHDDVRKLIADATEHPYFQTARQGEIPRQRLGELSDITGIAVDHLDESKLRLIMNGDAQFRIAGQILVQTQDAAFEAARNHRATNTFESRQEFLAAIMRRDIALEHIVGLNAEWGRTGNAIQDLYGTVKDAQALGRFIKDKKGEGWNTAKLDEVANELAATNSREAAGQFLTKTRNKNFTDTAIWWWTNAILSGPITHLKYMEANAAFMAFDTFVATPIAGIYGAARSKLTGDMNRVYMGETLVKFMGVTSGFWQAIYASGVAVKNGIPTAIPQAQPKGGGTVNPITNLAPVGGLAGQAMSGPSRVISGIHSFYNFLGYRSEIEAQAYRQTIKEGYSPLSKDFWERQYDHARFPDDDAMTAGVDAGMRANFVEDLGKWGKGIQLLAYQIPPLKFVLPFLKVPGNIFNRFREGTPLAFADARMRAELFGQTFNKETGKYEFDPTKGPNMDMAAGRLIGASAFLTWGAYQAIQHLSTGNGPIDPKQKAEWFLTNQPNSVMINGKWQSFDRYGPMGMWMGAASNLVEAGQEIDKAWSAGRLTETQKKKADKDMAEGFERVIVGTARVFNEAGFQGLSDLVNEMNDPSRTRAANVGRTVGTLMPYSSAQSQMASIMDPYLRDTQTFIDGIKNMIPGVRETLPVARDWTGAPRPNPAYATVLKTKEANVDPVDLEMQRLDIKPAKVPDQIRGVKLTREQYDEYQTRAGIATRTALNQWVNMPGWQNLPEFAKEKILVGNPFLHQKGAIDKAREQAAVSMMADYPNILGEATQDRQDRILQGKPKPFSFERP